VADPRKLVEFLLTGFSQNGVSDTISPMTQKEIIVQTLDRLAVEIDDLQKQKIKTLGQSDELKDIGDKLSAKIADQEQARKALHDLK
jgi:hypothetical protein